MQKGIETQRQRCLYKMPSYHDPTAEMQKGIETISNLFSIYFLSNDPTAEMQKGIETIKVGD